MRLIDADDLKTREALDALRCAEFDDEIEAVIDKIPTTCDAEGAVSELMILRDRHLHGECYQDRKELECSSGKTCRDCYEERVREILLGEERR